MAKFNGNVIENPEAYQAAIERRKRANANGTRREKLLAAIKGDGAEFRAWLFSELPPHLEPLRLESQAEMDRRDYDEERASAAYARYNREVKAHWAKFKPVPEFLSESMRDWGGLTDGQLAFARKRWAELQGRAVERDAAEAARRANAQPWAAGRQLVTGVIQSHRIDSVEIGFRRESSTLKGLLLLADGRKLWTSLPWVLLEERDVELKGRTITIKITITVSDDDATMAFGKRPALPKER